MVAELQKCANKWLIYGFIVWIIGNILRSGEIGISYKSLGDLTYLVGMLVFVYGCVLYVKAKGQHPAFGLLGFLSLLGLIVLFLLPDRFKKSKSK